MGNTCSSFSSVSGNEYLKRLCSSESICENDPFWNALLAFSLVDLDLVALSSSNSKLLEDHVATLCKNLGINNARTGNFNTLVIYFIHRLDGVIAHGVSDSLTNPFVWQVLNALFIIRVICKHFIQNLSEELIIQQFLKLRSDAVVEPDETISLFLSTLFKGLRHIPIHDSTVLLHLEIVNTLITLLASVMFHSDSAANNVFYIEVMQGKSSKHSDSLVMYLLRLYTSHETLPSYVYREDDSSSLGATLWSVMTLGMTGGPHSDVRKVNLGLQCSLLLLVLCNHTDTENPYRKSLSTVLAESEESNTLKPEVLYTTLCKDLESEQSTLLFYMLLHQNLMMKQFVLSRATGIDQLTIPLLKILYRQDKSNPQHVYLALIVLLILTEDDGFNKDLFETKVHTLKWYREQTLTDITLGDAVILVIIKAMQFNMAHTKDRYLHTNCLATLANMSAKFSNLHSYSCQRLVSFYCTLIKRHARIVEKLQLSSIKPDGVDHDMDTDALTMDLEAIEEMIRMFLELLNSCFTHGVHHNTNLIHVMLCQKDEFERFRSKEAFRPILQNICMVLEQFHLKLSKEFGDHSPSVQDVLNLIEGGLKTFRRSSFTKFPDLKFRYVEEAEPGKFFVPYVWHIVCNVSNLYFKPITFSV